jgi:hypothetical protein
VTPSRLPPYVKLHEPQLLFAADQDGAQDAHPLRGVLEYGPYTRRAFAQFTPKIRIATVGPPSGRDRVRALLTALRQAHAPGDRKEYVPPYPGFERLFGVGIAPAPPEAHLPLPESLSDLPGEGSATSRVVAALSDAIRRLEVVRDSFDVATFHLPDNWGPALRGDGFDAHDELKALGALYGIPTQVLNDRVFVFPYLASRSWRLGLAIYVKAGGVPWKIAPLPGIPDATAYIGLAYALRGDPRDARFVACCSQVFDSDGGGMRFVAYDARDPIDDTWEARHNPYLSRDDMQAVMSRSLREYQSRNGGEVPRRVVIYKTTAFRDDEIAGAADALEAVRELECIEITTAVAWRGVWLLKPRDSGARSEADGYPVHRGTMVPMSGTSMLVWAAGNAPAAAARGNFYQGGKSIPRPLLLARHAGAGPLELAAMEAIALTKMNWNNDALYDPEPVTVGYARRLARTIANVPTLPRNVYSYRLFM